MAQQMVFAGSIHHWDGGDGIVSFVMGQRYSSAHSIPSHLPPSFHHHWYIYPIDTMPRRQALLMAGEAHIIKIYPTGPPPLRTNDRSIDRSTDRSNFSRRISHFFSDDSIFRFFDCSPPRILVEEAILFSSTDSVFGSIGCSP